MKKDILRNIKFSILIACLSLNLLSQSDSLTPINLDPYKVNYKVEIPIIAVGFTLFYLQLPNLDGIASIEPQEVGNYKKSSINRLDKFVLNYPESGYKKASFRSDLVLNITSVAPVLLLLDKKIRKNWGDLITLYGEAQFGQSAFYIGSATFIRKARPFVYNSNLSITERSGKNTTKSFFSGHTSVTSTASFFMAKIYDDYHSLSKGQKVLLYAGASIPPALVGYYRMKAGMHFTSDVLTGFLLGAASGILVPEFHKVKPKGLSLVPIYNNNFKGLAFSLRL